MHCTFCGQGVTADAVACLHCGAAPKSHKNHCFHCGKRLEGHQVVCTGCGGFVAQPVPLSYEKDRQIAGVLALFLGSFGAHKFYLDYSNEGVITLVCVWLGIILCGIPTLIMSVIVLIEGITYLCMSDEEFQKTYVEGSKPWL